MRDGRGIAAFEEARTQQLVNLVGGVHDVSAHKVDVQAVPGAPWRSLRLMSGCQNSHGNKLAPC